MELNPFDLRGPEFLVFYIILALSVVGLVVLLRHAFESGQAPKIDLGDPYLIAYLRGGAQEAKRVALVTLIDRGLLILEGTQIRRAETARPDSCPPTHRKGLDGPVSKAWPSRLNF